MATQRTQKKWEKNNKIYLLQLFEWQEVESNETALTCPKTLF